MKQPEHMMADECHVDRSPPEGDEMREWCLEYVDNLGADALDFFEAYIDPEGPMRYGGDVWDACRYIAQHDVLRLYDACHEDMRDNR